MQLRTYLEKGCVDYVQPDLSHCGGVSAVKKMAAIAETYYVALAPHNPSGPVANAATLQIAGSTPGFRILEICLTDVSWRKELTDEKVVFQNGGHNGTFRGRVDMQSHRHHTVRAVDSMKHGVLRSR